MWFINNVDLTYGPVVHFQRLIQTVTLRKENDSWLCSGSISTNSIGRLLQISEGSIHQAMTCFWTPNETWCRLKCKILTSCVCLLSLSYLYSCYNNTNLTLVVFMWTENYPKLRRRMWNWKWSRKRGKFHD